MEERKEGYKARLERGWPKGRGHRTVVFPGGGPCGRGEEGDGCPEAMFRLDFYKFGGKMFRQLEGGPIGLRGTCSIARITMQMLDRKWLGLFILQNFCTLP